MRPNYYIFRTDDENVGIIEKIDIQNKDDGTEMINRLRTVPRCDFSKTNSRRADPVQQQIRFGGHFRD